MSLQKACKFNVLRGKQLRPVCCICPAWETWVCRAHSHASLSCCLDQGQEVAVMSWDQEAACCPVISGSHISLSSWVFRSVIAVNSFVVQNICTRNCPYVRYTCEVMAKIKIIDPFNTLTVFLGHFSIHPSHHLCLRQLEFCLMFLQICFSYHVLYKNNFTVCPLLCQWSQ